MNKLTNGVLNWGDDHTSSKLGRWPHNIVSWIFYSCWHIPTMDPKMYEV